MPPPEPFGPLPTNFATCVSVETELAPSFTAVAGVPVTGDCFADDRATFVFTDTASARFYRAVIE